MFQHLYQNIPQSFSLFHYYNTKFQIEIKVDNLARKCLRNSLPKGNRYTIDRSTDPLVDQEMYCLERNITFYLD